MYQELTVVAASAGFGAGALLSLTFDQWRRRANALEEASPGDLPEGVVLPKVDEGSADQRRIFRVVKPVTFKLAETVGVVGELDINPVLLEVVTIGDTRSARTAKRVARQRREAGAKRAAAASKRRTDAKKAREEKKAQTGKRKRRKSAPGEERAEV